MKKICLITGATEGIGKVTAIQLARKGFTVALAARNAAKAELVRQEIATSTGNADADYILADLNSLGQVHQLAETFKHRYPKLDVLVNNAGIFMPARTMTEDGYETTYQVNYLSHFCLTHWLLDELKKSEQGRVINLSSSVYVMGKFDEHNIQSERRFSTMGAYAASKLFMTMFTIELRRKLQATRVTANAVHPGIVRTQMMMRAPGVFRVISYLALPFSVSPQRGAATSVYLASSPEVKDFTGMYFVCSKPADVKTRFNTDEHRLALWNISMKALL